MQSLLIPVLIVTWAALLLTIMLTLTLMRRVNALSALLHRQPDLAVGQAAPAFQAETLNGQTVQLADYASRTALFVFIHPDCPSCRTELPMLQRIAGIAKRRANIELVLVSEGELAETRALAEEFKLTVPLVVAPRGSNSFARDYNPNGENPCYCVIDERGTVVSREMIGSREWLSLTQALESAPEPQTHRPVARAATFDPR